MTGSERYTFDTNILFYALDPDSGSKHEVAQQLIALASERNSVILLQTLGELCNAVKRKNMTLVATAHRFVLRTIDLFEVASAISPDLHRAIEANQLHGIPFWDAMVWATACRAGCSIVFTEDLQHERTLGGVTFLNPFLLSAADLQRFTL